MPACFASSVICPRQAAVTHSLLRPTFWATSDHLRPLATLVATIFSVTSRRLIFCSFVERSSHAMQGHARRGFGKRFLQARAHLGRLHRRLAVRQLLRARHEKVDQ